MEIRAQENVALDLKIINENFKRNVKITSDENAVVPILFAKNNSGELKEVLRGEKEIRDFVQYGYNRIIKFCPWLKKKCIGEECQLYIVEGITGDCALNWTAILTLNILKRNA